jgi:hypothetical protein
MGASGTRDWQRNGMKTIAAFGALFLFAPALAQTGLNWPETIDLLA